MLDSLEIILDYTYKMKDQVIILGDLNINLLKNDRNKENFYLICSVYMP
jgi:hypothetical protein